MGCTIYQATSYYGSASYDSGDICGFVDDDGTVYRATSYYGSASYDSSDIHGAVEQCGRLALQRKAGAAFILLV